MSILADPSAPPPDAARLFKVLADETRLAILRLLALTDLRGGEIVERVHLPHNAVSYHLKQLRELGLLRDRRSHADARDIYYSLDLDRLEFLYRQAGQTLHPGLARAAALDDAEGTTVGGEPPLRVLFLCTHNSARSQLAEGILRLRGGDAVSAFSAGSEPTTVHPLAIALLVEQGVDARRHRSKAVEHFAGQSFDSIITVCDRVRDHCPVFLGDPLRIHWSFPDPTTLSDADARERAFRDLWLELNTRVGHLLTLPHPVTGRRLAGRPTTPPTADVHGG
ncbi:MAG TPA: metalloregulator ArsR/SmtB family transcription factor [Chloroflexota bacterium]|nr:metalloregulator ArsR/SmtB family transcription factor [Chloroflexota bacterium]